GSWNAAKYPLRGERLDMLFKYPLAKGVLDIYDRYSGAQDSEPGLVYPEKYRDCLLPAVPYSKIANTVYKKYSVMLNVNSVENSDSMLARRIYELCGCGTPIVSSPSNAIKSELAGVVKIARNEQEAEAHISGILEDDIESLRISANGVRFIHDGNTYRHRFGEMLARLTASSSMTTGATIEKPAVTAICVSKRPWFAEQTARMLKQQNGVEVHAVYVAHGEDTNEQQVTELFKDFASFTFMRMIGDDKVLADGLNMALEQCKTDLVAKIDDDDYYGPNYLKDACLALEYSDSALVGKASFFCYVESSDDFALRFPGKHYRYLSRVHGGTLVWSRSKTQNQSFTRVKQGTDSYFIQGLKDKNLRVFSTDPFNFVHVRYSSNNAHTWAIEDEEFLQNAQKLSKGLNLDLSFN
ncbi:MAG: glycosyltransferase, partial [Firmicutes bacterium]|nr:glycosyltransferase [Bacillota bacterium]